MDETDKNLSEDFGRPKSKWRKKEYEKAYDCVKKRNEQILRDTDSVWNENKKLKNKHDMLFSEINKKNSRIRVEFALCLFLIFVAAIFFVVALVKSFWPCVGIAFLLLVAFFLFLLVLGKIEEGIDEKHTIHRVSLY